MDTHQTGTGIFVDNRQGLTFANLGDANIQRQAEWKGDQLCGLLFRATELGGEVGEALNVAKKIERERMGVAGSRASIQDLANELADVVICCELLAASEGIDLGAAIIAKFNATSAKMGLRTTLNLC